MESVEAALDVDGDPELADEEDVDEADEPKRGVEGVGVRPGIDMLGAEVGKEGDVVDAPLVLALLLALPLALLPALLLALPLALLPAVELPLEPKQAVLVLVWTVKTPELPALPCAS